MKLANNKVKFKTYLVDPIIVLERLLEMILKKLDKIAIKYYNIPNSDSEFYEIKFNYYGRQSPEDWPTVALQELDYQQ